MKIWLLIFCSHVYTGVQCLAPIKQPNEQICNFVGQKMNQTAYAVWSIKGISVYHCISVPETSSKDN